jgi:glycerophosphoryl diester phosphodiesterase
MDSPSPEMEHTSRVERLLKLDRPLVIAHRGFSRIAPENTLPSFACALAANADLVELDFQVSSDAVPVVFHDDTLDRTTDAPERWGRRGVRVEEVTGEQLTELDAGAWFGPEFAGTRIPSLSEALHYIHRRGGVTFVERKSGSAADTADLLRNAGLVNEVIVLAFDWAYLAELHALLPAQVLGALGPAEDGDPLTGEAVAEASRIGAAVLGWSPHVSAEAVDFAHAAGLQVWIYTVDDVAEAQTLVAKGVDGIITNDPLTIGLKLGLSRPAQ